MARKPTPPAVGPVTEPASSPPNNSGNGFKEELDKKIGPLVPQPQRVEIVSRVYRMLVNENFSGPIPHPRHFREYEDILPGSAERILAMAERVQAHNIAMEAKNLAAEHDDRKRGMRFGFAALVLIVACAAFFGYEREIGLAALFLGSAALGVIAVFVQGRLDKSK